MEGLTWKDTLRLPHESNWSVHQKKCFIDAFTVKRLSGDKSSKNSSQQISVSKDLAIRDQYCPECARHGYHAWFHQLNFADRCILHPDQQLKQIDDNSSRCIGESFYQRIGARAIDLIDNAEMRYKIESTVHFNFDCITIVDLIENRAGFPNSIRPYLYKSSLKTLQECCNGNSFTTARKIANIGEEVNGELTSWTFDYLKNRVVPWLISKDNMSPTLGDEPIEEFSKKLNSSLHLEWQSKLKHNPRDVINLLLHKEFLDICDQIGDKRFDEIHSYIFNKNFDTEICSYEIYARIITLILSSGYSTSRTLSQLHGSKKYVNGIPYYSNKIPFSAIDMDHKINLKIDDTRRMDVPILAAILKDVLNHTAALLAKMIPDKSCFVGESYNGGIYDRFFCFPISQYIAIWKSDSIEIWACDPDIDALLYNLNQANEIGRHYATYNHTWRQV